MRVLAAMVLGVLLSVAGVQIGAWWFTFVVGLAVGVAITRARLAVPTGALVALLSWALLLAWAHTRYDLGSTAASLAAIMGFGHQGAIPVVLTCLVGLLLGLTGAWLGSAGRTLVQPATSRKNASVSADGATPSSR